LSASRICSALLTGMELTRISHEWIGLALKGLPMTDSGSVIDWLLGSDPSVRWQVMRDLLDAPESAWTAEQAKVETEGWGARLLSYQDEDGQWAYTR
jgi:hypothetical protein